MPSSVISSVSRRSAFSTSPSVSISSFRSSRASSHSAKLRAGLAALPYRSNSLVLHGSSAASLPSLTQVRTMASERAKIKVKNPVVELDGDEV